MKKKSTKFNNPTVADFFAGIGLVTMGLEKSGWQTIYALDYEKEKASTYTNQFGSGHYHTKVDKKGVRYLFLNLSPLYSPLKEKTHLNRCVSMLRR